MTPKEFNDGMKGLEACFPGVLFAEKTMSAWYPHLKELPLDGFKRALSMIIENNDKLWPDTNMVSVIRKYASPLLTENTIADHLFYAVSLAKGNGENPYSYLKRLDVELCEMADRMGMFAADAGSESLRFMVRDIAKSWIERRENLKRGFDTPRTEYPKALPCPPKTLLDMPQKQLEANKKTIRGIIEKLKNRAAE